MRGYAAAAGWAATGVALVAMGSPSEKILTVLGASSIVAGGLVAVLEARSRHRS